jgi:hypothetical protein
MEVGHALILLTTPVSKTFTLELFSTSQVTNLCLVVHETKHM